MVAHYMFFVSLFFIYLSEASTSQSIVRGHVDPLADLLGLLHAAEAELHRQENAQTLSFAQVRAACTQVGSNEIQTDESNNGTILEHSSPLVNHLECIAKTKDHEAWEKKHTQESSAVHDVLEMITTSEPLHLSIKSLPAFVHSIRTYPQHQELRGWKSHSPSRSGEVFDLAADRPLTRTNPMLLSVSQDEIETRPAGAVVLSDRAKLRNGEDVSAKQETSVGTKSATTQSLGMSHFSPNIVDTSKTPCAVRAAREETLLLQKNRDIADVDAQMSAKASRIEALHQSIAEVDRQVMKLTATRKTEHTESKEAAAAGVSAVNVIQHAIKRFEGCSDSKSTRIKRERNRSSLRQPMTKVADGDQGVATEIGESVVMLEQLKVNLEHASAQALRDESMALQDYANAMASSADQRQSITAQLREATKSGREVDELQRRRLKLLKEKEQIDQHLNVLQHQCASTCHTCATGNINADPKQVLDADRLEMQMRKEFGDVNYYMLVILGLVLVCSVLICVLVCVIRQMYRSSSRTPRGSSSSRARFEVARAPGSDRRVQLPNYTSEIHGAVQVETVQAEAVPPRQPGSSDDFPPTPSFMPPKPVGERQPGHQDTLFSILKKQGSPERGSMGSAQGSQNQSMVSDESNSMWGAWSGHELTDEQIDMMVREAEAKQQKERMRQHLVDEGREALQERPRPWWKPEGGPRFSPQPLDRQSSVTSRQSSVPTLLHPGEEAGPASSGTPPKIPTPPLSAGIGTPPSDDLTIQGVSMFQALEKKGSAFMTPHTRQPRWSLGSDGGPTSSMGISLHSPDRVLSARDGREQTTPQSTQQQVTTPGKWLWSPNSLNNFRSLTPPPMPGEPAPSAPPRRAQSSSHSARPRSLGSNPAVAPKSPPVSSRVTLEGPTAFVYQQYGSTPSASSAAPLQYGTTPPPTPPNLIRGNNGHPVAVPPVVPPLWRNLTPPHSARDQYMMRSPAQHR